MHELEEEKEVEQSKLTKVVAEKQRIIDLQERRILSLDAANTQLLSALSHIKDRCHNQNGVTAERLTFSLPDDQEFKSSSC